MLSDMSSSRLRSLLTMLNEDLNAETDENARDFISERIAFVTEELTSRPATQYAHTCLMCGDTFWSALLVSPAFTAHQESCCYCYNSPNLSHEVCEQLYGKSI